jgi:type IV pilus assembly protein PilP
MYLVRHKDHLGRHSNYRLTKRVGGLLIAVVALAGCSSDLDTLQKEVEEIRKRTGEPIQPMREIKPYEAFVYNAVSIRSPFTASVPALTDASSALRPDSKRAREYLEQFPIDSLKMVGILELHGRKYGLIQDKQGLVHRVLPGNYLGQNDGRITGVTNAKISLIQIVADGLGGYIERPHALPLAE